MLKGYVTRLFPDEYQREPVIELAMPAPVGMSGAPLFNVQRPATRRGPSLDPFECFGVVFRERTLQTADGELRYGTALRLDTLRNAMAPATGSIPLAEYLLRDSAREPETTNTAPSE